MFLLFLCADLLSPVAWFTQLNSTVSVCRSVVSCCLVYDEYAYGIPNPECKPKCTPR